jgi:SAM-dependent methyltransferase
MRHQVVLKQNVMDFWNREACGERYGDAQDRLRYELEPEIVPFADFSSTAGLKVLEVGVGMGSDSVRFAAAGAVLTGIDLTQRAVDITRRRLSLNRLSADIRVADAEELPFADASFDVVYSWGVLHHTPNTRRALSEACRVLVPGGRLKAMLYHRWSWVAFAAWVRFGLLRGRLTYSLRDAVACIESPGTQAFTESEIREMLPGIREMSVAPHLTSWDRKYFPGVSSIGGDKLGWYLLVSGTK